MLLAGHGTLHAFSLALSLDAGFQVYGKQRLCQERRMLSKYLGTHSMSPYRRGLFEVPETVDCKATLSLLPDYVQEMIRCNARASMTKVQVI